MIGGDLIIKEHRFNHRNGKSHTLYNHSGDLKQISTFNAILLFVNSYIASDPFWMPYHMRVGLLFNIIIFICVTLMILGSFRLYEKSWLYGFSYSFPTIWKLSIKKGAAICQFIVIFGYLSISIRLTEETHKNAITIVNQLVREPPKILSSKWFWLYAAGFTSTFFPLFHLRFSRLLVLTYLAVGGLLIGCFCAIIDSIRHINKVGINPNHQFKLFNFDPNFIGANFDLYSILYSVVHLSDNIFCDLERPTLQRINFIFDFAAIFSGFLTVVVGVFGYLSFYDANNNVNILFMFEPKDVIATIGKIGNYFSTILTNGLYIYAAAKELANMIFPSKNNRIPVVTAGLVLISLAISFSFMPHVAITIAAYIGVCFRVTLSFFMPPLFYVIYHGKSSLFWLSCSILIAVFGILMIVLISISRIHDIYKELN